MKWVKEKKKTAGTLRTTRIDRKSGLIKNRFYFIYMYYQLFYFIHFFARTARTTRTTRTLQGSKQLGLGLARNSPS